MVKFTQGELVMAVLSVLSRDLDEIEGAFGMAIRSIPLRKLNFDSLAILELVIALEESHGISLNPSDFALSAEATIDELLDYVNNRET
jgi:acyl carrier protein